MATDVRTPAGNWYPETASDMQAWVGAVHNALAAVGLVQTADTGQVNPATVALAGGYEIWRFNDALQATAPVFIKIEYGNGQIIGGFSRSATIWLTFGTGSNGAGTITGIATAQTKLQFSNGGGSLAGLPIWTSGANNRIAQCIARSGNTNNNSTFWAVERTKDATGADTPDGIHICMRTAVVAGSLVPQFYSQTLLFGSTLPQALAQGPMCVVGNDGTASDSGNVGWFPWQMASRRGPEYPPLGWLSYCYGDLNGGTDQVVSVYGSNHTYRTLGADAAQTNVQGIQRAGWRPTTTSSTVTAHDSVHFAMRWE